MKTSKLILAAVIIVSLVFIAVPAVSARGATMSVVNPGDTIFEFEHDLDLGNLADPADPTLTGNVTSLRKYSDDDITKAMIDEIPVSDQTDFDVLSSLVGGAYGIYYAFAPSRGVVSGMYVQIREPTSTLGVVMASDHTESLNGKIVTRTTPIQFKIEAPHVAATYRNVTSGTYARVRIEVTTPGGGKLSIFGGTDLQDIPLISTQIYTTSCDLSAAEAGTYSAKAEWVFPDGFADEADPSNVVTFSVATKGLGITTNKVTVVKGGSFTVTITGESKYTYYLYITDAGVSGYPLLITGQTDVNAAAGPYTNVSDDTNVAGTHALVKTDASGTIPVAFDTDSARDDEEYTIKVLNIGDTSKYDTVDVSVAKGDVTLTMGGSGTFYMGDVIDLLGSSSAGDYVYLFIVGPNLNSNGVRIDKPDIGCSNTVESTFKKVTVDADNEWKYKWDTSDFGVVLDPGSYTLYAVNEPKCKGSLSGTSYETASITLKKGYLSVKLSSNSVASGDKFVVSGTASGAPDRIYIWIFGKNYRNMFNSVSVDSDGTYEYELDDTANLYAGQYYLVVQHPMANGPGIRTVGGCSGTGCSEIEGDPLYYGWGPVRLAGLQAPDAAKSLTDALDSPNVDDVYTSISFTVDNPFITISSVPDKRVGDSITLSGITNLATGDEIMIDVMSSSFKPSEKTQSSEFSAASGMAVVERNNESASGYNTFRFEFDTNGFKADQYMVLAESIDTGTTATIMFNLREYVATPVPTPVITPVQTLATPLPTPIPTPLPTPPTIEPTTTPTKTPGFGAVIAVVGLCVVGYLVLRKNNQS
jgi:PGF-CTERM protein